MTTATMTAAPAQSPDVSDESQHSNGSSNGNGHMIVRPGFGSSDSFQLLQQMATVFAKSHIVPALFRGNAPNSLIACHLANRMKCDPLTVMQNLYIVNGKPSWSAQFLMSIWNSCGLFTPIRFEWVTNDRNQRVGCRAYSIEKSTGDRLEGATVTIEMARGEGWTTKPGSKWVTMPDQMFMYRAATFLVRAFAPELGMGLHTSDEMEDVTGERAIPSSDQQFLHAAKAMNSKAIAASAAAAKPDPDVIDVQAEPANEIKPEVKTEVKDEAKRPAEPAAVGPQTAKTAAPQSPATVNESQSPAVSTSPEATTTPDVKPDANQEPVCKDTLKRIGALLNELQPPKAVVMQILQSLGVSKATELSESDAGRLVAWAQKKLDVLRLEKWSETATQAPADRVAANGAKSGKEAAPTELPEEAPFH